MGRVTRLSVRNYRSFGDWTEVRFPKNGPLVVFGENNAGKSNLVSALELVLGERWPGNYKPEDHEFHQRSRDNLPMQVVIDVDGVRHDDRYRTRDVQQFNWTFSAKPEDDGLAMGFTSGESSPYVSNATREQCFCITITADRRLSYQLSYSSQWTFLSKLMREFHEALVADEDRVRVLEQHFEQVKGIFQEVDEFKTFTEEFVAQVADLSGNVGYRLDVDFSAYDPTNYFRSLRVFPTRNGQLRAFEEIGTGQEQILAIAFAWSYAKAFHGAADAGLLLVIEEPEAHLHPLAQRWLSRRLHELAGEGLQIVVTTHSPAFIDLANLEGLVRVSKPGEATQTCQHTVETFVEYCRETGATSASRDTTISRYRAWATEEILTGLFARRCVLVEGPTEALALPELLARAGYDAEREGTAFVNVRGVADLAKWWRFFTAYDIPCYALFDRDEGDDRDGQKRRDLLTAAGLNGSQIDAVLASSEDVESALYTMLAPDFEGAMRRLFGQQYADLEHEAQQEHGLSGGHAKPLVARYVATRVAMSDGDPGRQFLERLADHLRKLPAVSHATMESEDMPF